MGLAASLGKDNDELIDNLASNDSLKTERIEKIMRLVDRGKFLPENERENAYKDSAWKSVTGDPGFLHMSAPCIYASVLENFDLGAGMSFLNIGSGTGYFSSMVGFIIGEKGVSHGVELYPNVTEFANDKISLIQQSGEASAFDWCPPTYETGNAFQIESQMKYDRIYCGALVPDSHRSYFCSFLKVGGVLILPYGHFLQRIVRNSESEFLTRDISTVTFSHLIPVNPENPLTNRPIKLPMFEPHSLCSICRDFIRRCVRAKVQQTHKVEMRTLCTSPTGEGRTRNEEGVGVERVEEFPPWIDRIRENNNNRRLPGQRRRLQTIHFFADEDNDDEDRAEPEEDHHHIITTFHRNPMRHFFALVARERLNRHHAARARQEAGLADANERLQMLNERLQILNERRQIRGQIRVIIGNQNLEPVHNQATPANEDTTYGFRFISENNLNVDIDPQDPAHDEDDDGGEDDDNEGDNSEVAEETDQMQATDEEAEQDKTLHPLASSSRTVADEPSLIHLSSSDVAISHSVDANNAEEMAKSSGENGPRISMKRQRAITRSLSVDHSPQLKRIFSNHDCSSTEKPSTSKTTENCTDGDKISVEDGQMGADKCGCATEDDDNSSTFSTPQKNENFSCLTAEQQSDYMRAFHAEFARLLDTLPLNVQMHKFLKYEIN